MSGRLWEWLLELDDSAWSRWQRAAYIAAALAWSIVAGVLYEASTGKAWTSR